jgi:hypothetical protein
MQSIVWNADGRWFLSSGDTVWEAKLRSDSWVNGGAMLLRWEALDGNAARSCMLLTAADLDPASFRRLGIRLRIDGLKATRVTDALLA